MLVRWFKLLAERVLLIIFSLMIGEVVLRTLNYHPIGSIGFPVFAPIIQPDDEIGWIMKGGSFGDTHLNVDGNRITGSVQSQSKTESRPVVFVGCSTTHGTGLRDEETLPWKVQSRLAGLRVYNFGVVGYGACQAMLLLQRLLKREEFKTSPIVVYLAWPAHEMRSTAHPFYLWQIASASPSQTASMPWCSVDSSGGVVVNPAEKFSLSFPALFKHTAIGRLIGDTYYWEIGKSRQVQMRSVNKALLLEMNQLVRARHGRFIVIVAGSDSDFFVDHEEYFRANGVEYLDGRYPAPDISPYIIKDDGHPNDRMTGIWAELLINYLSETQ